MQNENIKDKAHQLLDNLPDSATWEDLMYRIYVREAIEAGIKDSDKGRTVEVKEVRRKYRVKQDRIDVLAVIHGAQLLSPEIK